MVYQLIALYTHNGYECQEFMFLQLSITTIGSEELVKFTWVLKEETTKKEQTHKMQYLIPSIYLNDAISP